MGEAVVEFDYAAQESDELTIRKGDVIRDIVKKPGGWWEGTLRDKRGMFPDNFVTLIQKMPPKPKQQQPPQQNRLRQCKAIFSYNPAHEDELHLNVGDIIDVIAEVEEGWWKGRLGHKEGVFPSNFVEEIMPSKSQNSSKEDLTSLPSDCELGTPSLPPKPTKIICRVKYPYDACNEDELTLREGDLITLISKDGQDKGWWRGELRGQIGVFPDNFVVVVHAMDGTQSQLSKSQEKLSNNKSLNNRSSTDENNAKPLNVASQRKSLELKTTDDPHKVPPLPGKKPNVPKKSPSSANSTASTVSMANLKQKMIDRVDGAASSRAVAHNSHNSNAAADEDNYEFDQVERSALLPDMRQNRAKKPGRRPPSVVFRETDSNLVNGNAEHLQQQVQQATAADTSNDEEDEKKPKVREWEKHKAPWVEELKLNQAKRTSVTPPGPTADTRLKLTPTPTDKPEECGPSPEVKQRSPAFAFQDTSSPVDMTKSMSALSTSSTKLKTPTPINDIDKSPTTTTTTVPLRVKSSSSQQQPITTTPVRPQSIHGTTTNLSTSPSSITTPTPTPLPAAKPPVAEKINLDATKLITAGSRSSLEKKVDMISLKQYLELQDRLTHMEQKMQQQFLDMQTVIDDLKGKLQIEVDMRRLLQAELEKVAQCVTQV